MKRATNLLLTLCLLCLCILPLFSFGEEAYISITTRQELESMGANPSGRYRLEADIDLGDSPWKPIPFSGELDGNGHILLNLTVEDVGEERRTTIDGNRLKYDTAFAGLFSVAEGAHIHDLSLINARVSITTEENCFIAGLCGYARDCTFENITLSCRNTLRCALVNEGIGGLMGYCFDSETRGCNVDAELVFTDTNRDIDCESFLGGIYASGCGRIFDTNVKLRGYASIYGYAHSGGFVGMCKMLSNGYNPRLKTSTSDTIISFFECAPSRRAYCDAFIGEDCGDNCYMSGNKEIYYEHHEIKDYETLLLPEMCANPAYRTEETPYDCQSLGFTTYTCESCGYSYTDDYHLPAHHYEAEVTAPTCTEEGYTTYTCSGCQDSYVEDIVPAAHTPGEWETALEPQPGAEGKEVKKCTVCGEILEARTLEALPLPTQAPVQSTEEPVEVDKGENRENVDIKTDGNEAPARRNLWENIVYYLFFGWLFQ